MYENYLIYGRILGTGVYSSLTEIPRILAVALLDFVCLYTLCTAAQSSKSFTSFSSPFRTLRAYEKDFIFHKEVGQFYVLNFQGTVYIRNGITYSLPLIGGSIFLVNPGSILIINQHLEPVFNL